jgi:hypothetical protein
MSAGALQMRLLAEYDRWRPPGLAKRPPDTRR